MFFKSFTGLEITEFDIISKEIESKYYEHEIKRLSNRKRKRDVGAGSPTTPPQVEKILDLGYLGVKNDFPTVKYVLPFKKKTKSEL